MAKLLTAESVTSGHPDKICDQISDAVLDAFLAQDSSSRVAIETFGGHGLVLVAGEVTSNADVDISEIVRNVYRGVGYSDNLKIIVHVVRQSLDIGQGVDTGGAGDQGIMYGYATNETPEFMPLPVVLAHKLTKGLEQLRLNNSQFNWLEPDGKSQVTLGGLKVKSVLVSCQHKDSISSEEIFKQIKKGLVLPVIGAGTYEVLVNPTGRFVQGGFAADTGLTGRKLMVDTYGGIFPHGGGCFSGKDPTKVDRSGAYMARFVAKNIVANKYAKRCLVSLAYAIGRAEPLMVEVDTYGTGDNRAILKKILKIFDFSPRGIIKLLQLNKPIYAAAATYGHFGKPDLSWEAVIKI